ncbi:hypothetical protein CFK38_03685 [Brachybacterium vulturis]|uniref:Lipoprotein n=1 Tax=Brachybacterium vulturis TaxID=2017484 RepID=A0A291GKX6_9MICO|nr:hypothetical protein [Brachybacterium vulturis]ATG50720.1 hypothetical protein CFK38_03685 [Brachybacterium vulturis]
MRTAITRGMAALSLTLLALSACSGGDPGGGGDSGGDSGMRGYGGGQQSQDPAASDGGAGTDTAAVGLATAETELGTIVVDGAGMVVYQFDQDEQGSGTSTCTGQCAENWPAVPGDSSAEIEGVTGEVGSITGVDGQPQLTLDGWPLYYYAGDEEPGDTTGQGVGGVWWVLSPEGEVLRS